MYVYVYVPVWLGFRYSSLLWKVEVQLQPLLCFQNLPSYSFHTFLKTCFSVYQSPTECQRRYWCPIFLHIGYLFYHTKIYCHTESQITIQWPSVHVVAHESVNETILNLSNPFLVSVSQLDVMDVLVTLQLWKARKTWFLSVISSCFRRMCSLSSEFNTRIVDFNLEYWQCMWKIVR